MWARSSRTLEAELRGVEADLERLWLEQAEPHLQHRQSVYHDFLDSAHRFYQDRTGTEEFESTDDLQVWFRDFEHRLSAVRLFGHRGGPPVLRKT